MEQNSISQMLTAHDWKKIITLSDVEVGEFIVSVINEYDSRYPAVDFDKLLSMGVAFAKYGHENSDEIILNWLVENPSTPNLDLVSTLLHGLWNRAYRQRAVSYQKVDLLMKARKGLILDEQTQYSYVLALCKVMNSDAPRPLKNRIDEVLESVLKEKFNNTHLDQLLKSAVHQALKF